MSGFLNKLNPVRIINSLFGNEIVANVAPKVKYACPVEIGDLSKKALASKPQDMGLSKAWTNPILILGLIVGLILVVVLVCLPARKRAEKRKENFENCHTEAMRRKLKKMKVDKNHVKKFKNHIESILKKPQFIKQLKYRVVVKDRKRYLDLKKLKKLLWAECSKPLSLHTPELLEVVKTAIWSCNPCAGRPSRKEVFFNGLKKKYLRDAFKQGFAQAIKELKLYESPPAPLSSKNLDRIQKREKRTQRNIDDLTKGADRIFNNFLYSQLKLRVPTPKKKKRKAKQRRPANIPAPTFQNRHHKSSPRNTASGPLDHNDFFFEHEGRAQKRLEKIAPKNRQHGGGNMSTSRDLAPPNTSIYASTTPTRGFSELVINPKWTSRLDDNMPIPTISPVAAQDSHRFEQARPAILKKKKRRTRRQPAMAANTSRFSWDNNNSNYTSSPRASSRTRRLKY